MPNQLTITERDYRWRATLDITANTHTEAAILAEADIPTPDEHTRWIASNTKDRHLIIEWETSDLGAVDSQRQAILAYLDGITTQLRPIIRYLEMHNQEHHTVDNRLSRLEK